MQTKAEKQKGALERFTVRERRSEETPEQYKAYLSRKEQEKATLIKAVGENHVK